LCRHIRSGNPASTFRLIQPVGEMATWKGLRARVAGIFRSGQDAG
jgi:hypothetical protein